MSLDRKGGDGPGQRTAAAKKKIISRRQAANTREGSRHRDTARIVALLAVGDRREATRLVAERAWLARREVERLVCERPFGKRWSA